MGALVREGAVRQRLLQKRRVAKGDADLLLELIQAPRGDVGVGDRRATTTARFGSAYKPDSSCFSWRFTAERLTANLREGSGKGRATDLLASP